MTADIVALPDLPIPGCIFRRDEVVEVRGEPALFLGLVTPAEGEPLAKLWPFTGGGCRFVRIGDVRRYGEQDA